MRDQGGHYLLAVKANQGNLHAETKNFFDQAIQVTPKEASCDYYSIEEKSRERFEKREVWCTHELDWLPQKEEWVDLNALVCMRSTRCIKDKTSIEARYYIASEKANAEKHGLGIRLHWGIESAPQAHKEVQEELKLCA
ncbi:hypothetical protein DB42_DM00010 [Neochlamydia sp. EPS4]|nr:hypothetical protein DB42_DM00010 [Neochlamydia sp. EPS4]